MKFIEGFHFNFENFLFNIKIFRRPRIIFRIFSRLMCPLG
ncbi:hypothetical protein ZYGNAAKF_CDS0167 [Enterococcus phage VRE9_2]